MTEQVIIEFIPDFSKLETGLDQVAKTGKVDVKGFKDIQAAIDDTATDTQGLIKQFKEVAGASVKMGKSIEDAFGEGVKDALDEAGVSVKQFEDALKKANAPSQSLKKELLQLKEAMARMKAEGKDTGKEFDSLRQRAGKLADAISDTNAEIKNAGSDTRGIDNVVGSISALAGGYAAVQGAAALFGEENEDLQKSLLKVNGAMALATGLQQVLNGLQKEGAITKLADSVATGAQSAAQKIYAVAVGTSTGAMKAFRVALLATGIGAIIALLVLAADAMGVFGNNTDESKTSLEDFNKALEAQNRLLDENISKIETSGKANSERLKQHGRDALAVALNDLKTQNTILKKLEDQQLQNAKDRNRNQVKIADIDFQLSQKIGNKKAAQLQKEKEVLLSIDASYGEDSIALEKRIQSLKNDIIIGNVTTLGIADSIRKEQLKKEADANEARKKAAEKAQAELKKLRDEEIAYDNLIAKERKKISDDIYDNEIKNIKKTRAAQIAMWNKALEKFKEIKDDEKQEDIDYYEGKWEQGAKDSAIEDEKLAQTVRNANAAIQLAERTAAVFNLLAAAQSAKDNAMINSKRREVEEQLKAGAITAKAAEARQKQIDEFERRARQRAAEREKKVAVFQAVLAIPKAFLQGLTSAPPPYGAILGGIAAALAAVEAGIIASTPVPKFFKGKKGNYQGPGIVGDMGSEIVERGGRMFLYTKPTQTYLGEKDKVYTAAETRKMLHSTSINTTISPAKQERFDYNKFAKAIPANAVNINIDKDFITESVAKGLTKNRYMDRRYSSK